MHMMIHDVTDITIEDVDSGASGTTWRKVKVIGRCGTHEFVLFAARDDAENLELTLGEKG